MAVHLPDSVRIGLATSNEEENRREENYRKQTRVKGNEDRRVVEFFVKHGQFLLPMIDLIEQSSGAIDEMIDVVGRGAVEAVLQLSAQQLTGAKS